MVRKSPLLKCFSAFFLMFGIALFMQISTVYTLESMPKIIMSQGPSQEFLNIAYNCIIQIQISIFFQFPTLMIYTVTSFMELIFQRISNRPFSVFNLDNLLNLLLFVFITWTYTIFNYNVVHFHLPSKLEAYENIKSLVFQPEQTLAFASIAGVMWLKVINYLHVTRTVGPLLVIIRRMSKDIFNFLSLACLVLLLFSCIGMVMFAVPNFSSFGNSIITLYSWMLGDFHFDDMASQGLRGSLFLSLYLLVSLVLLLNLLIAVLSSTFSQLESHGVGLYLQSLIDEYPRYAYHPTLNFLTYHTSPLNLLSFVCFPCAKKWPSKCGVLLEAIYYLPLFVLVLTGVIVINVICFPFAYFSLLKHYCISMTPLKFLLILLCYPLYFPVVTLLDLVVSIIQLWSPASSNPSKSNHSMSVNPLLSKDLNLLQSTLNQFYTGETHFTPLSKLVRHIRIELPFTCNFYDLSQIVSLSHPDALLSISPIPEFPPVSQLSNSTSRFLPSPSTNDESSIANHQDTFTRFRAIKQILSSNSFTDSTGRVLIYPGLLLLTLLEVKTMWSLQQQRQQRKRQKAKKKERVYSLNQARSEEQVSMSQIYCLRTGKFIQKENQRRLEEVSLKEMFIKFMERESGNWIEKNVVEEKRLTPDRQRVSKLLRKLDRENQF